MTPEAVAFQQTPVVTFGYIVQVFFSLAVVIGFIWLIGKFLLPKMKVSSVGKLITIVDRVYLEPSVTSYILKVGKDAWLVVVGNKQVAKIDKVNIE